MRPRAVTGIVEKKDDARPRAATHKALILVNSHSLQLKKIEHKDDVSEGMTEKAAMLSWKLKHHLCFRSVLLLESFAHTVPL